MDGRPNFHINLVLDVSPYCDCHGENDVPIIPDVGMFARLRSGSLWIRHAQMPATRRTHTRKSSDERMHEKGFCDHHDHFVNTTPQSEWKTCLAHAEKIGLGSRDYELIQV